MESTASLDAAENTRKPQESAKPCQNPWRRAAQAQWRSEWRSNLKFIAWILEGWRTTWSLELSLGKAAGWGKNVGVSRGVVWRKPPRMIKSNSNAERAESNLEYKLTNFTSPPFFASSSSSLRPDAAATKFIWFAPFPLQAGRKISRHYIILYPQALFVIKERFFQEASNDLPNALASSAAWPSM